MKSLEMTGSKLIGLKTFSLLGRVNTGVNTGKRKCLNNLKLDYVNNNVFASTKQQW